ncbi:hypothetical protein [Deinococcus radiotolerans]|uniref:Lipoprotein n=1 Tax=Deinococcus radiotolerans TaxID=1309407 RepID=A0ABQ2FIY2_9DEIO|nr:hypothetical protein [Deinococcus radiotolerans]GGK91919.1 hypothetical protein GCM10010844_07970 [Deinococcus radiotolerans]
MKRFVLCLPLLLAACGFSPRVPPTVGDLLSAPTALNVGGQVVTLDSASASGAGGFGVKVRLNSRDALPALKLDGVFVVSGTDLWKSPLRSSGAQGSAFGRSGASVQPGETVQVVVRLRDAQGRPLWLRDGETRVGTAP